MASLKIIRKRITSVRSTQQITKAMKMVAAAKLRRAQEAVVRSRAYSEKLREVVANLASEASLLEHRLVKAHPVETPRVLLILLTADRGLCGGFNASLIRQSEVFLGENGGSPSLSVIGRKGFDYYKKRATPIRNHYIGIASRPLVELSREIVARVVAAFIEDEIDEVHILYSKFRSALSQVPTVERLLPIETPAEIENPREYLFEPDREGVIESLLPRYVEVKVFQAFLETIASEHGARMTAMESATNNASDMIERLTLEMNRARQATITKELMEIVSGAEALKG
ncbi:MAG TPA: ATP synthase F1 subunit gamma [Candidatus Binatia bacterium]|jgi:F-type H+-transporting ATPase subunit gamma